jgi:hypothetical protein
MDFKTDINGKQAAFSGKFRARKRRNNRRKYEFITL